MVSADIKNEQTNTRPNRRRRREIGPLKTLGILAVSGIAGGTLISHINTMESNNPIDKGLPSKEYIVKPHDTAWSISQRAFPNSDPREHTDMIIQQAGNTLNPGEAISLPADANIGKSVPVAENK